VYENQFGKSFLIVKAYFPELRGYINTAEIFCIEVLPIAKPKIGSGQLLALRA